MKQGKDLDRLIQLQIFKSNALYDVRKELSPIMSMVTLEEAMKYKQEEGYTIISSTYVPRYSEDLQEAIKVVNELSNRYYHFLIQKHVNGKWEASFGNIVDHYTGTSDNPAHAICLAALNLLGIIQD